MKWPTDGILQPSTPAEKERLIAMGIELEEHQSRLNGLSVSRAFGDFFPKENGVGMISAPYVSTVYELGPKDTHLILASDGVRNRVSIFLLRFLKKSKKIYLSHLFSFGMLWQVNMPLT